MNENAFLICEHGTNWLFLCFDSRIALFHVKSREVMLPISQSWAMYFTRNNTSSYHLSSNLCLYMDGLETLKTSLTRPYRMVLYFFTKSKTYKWKSAFQTRQEITNTFRNLLITFAWNKSFGNTHRMCWFTWAFTTSHLVKFRRYVRDKGVKNEG